VPLDPSPRRQLGFLQGSVDAAFFEPLPADELEDSDNTLVVSAASAWEIATKWRLGKLQHARVVVENCAMALQRLGSDRGHAAPPQLPGVQPGEGLQWT